MLEKISNILFDPVTLLETRTETGTPATSLRRSARQECRKVLNLSLLLSLPGRSGVWTYVLVCLSQ